MFASILRFELRYWFRGWMIYIFLTILFFLFLGASSSDQIVVGGAIENTHRNSPFVIQNYYAIGSILTLLMTTAFVSAAATRDFTYQTNQIVFTTPVDKHSYLAGRFLGSVLAALFPLLGISLGIVFASLLPVNDPERWGANQLLPHVASWLCFAIPNTLLIAAVIFSVAAATRSTTFAFVSAIALLLAYGFSGSLTSNLDNERLAGMLDPFGVQPFQNITRYWTIAERNTLSVLLQGDLLINRGLWLAVAAVIYTVGASRFTFSERALRRKQVRVIDDSVSDLPLAGAPQPLSNVLTSKAGIVAAPAAVGASWWQLVRAQCWLDFRETASSRVFVILAAVSLLNLAAMLFSRSSEGYGNAALPITYDIIDGIRGSTYAFLIAILTFYSGVVVWKEREARLDEVYDAMPYPTWTTYVAKLLTILGIVFIFLVVSVLAGVLFQSLKGYTRFQLDVYAMELLTLDFLQFSFLAVLAMFCHIVSPNKYVGYFMFVLLLIANAFGWYLLDWSTLLVRYGSLPDYTYSDFYGIQPYAASLSWFAVYWTCGAVLLGIVSSLLWQRGRETSVKRRLQEARQRMRGPASALAVSVLVVFLAVGSWIYYNTQMQNQLLTGEQQKDMQAEYEEAYRQHLEIPQPRVTTVSYSIDLFPETRTLHFRGKQTIENKHSEPISQLHFTVAQLLETDIDLPQSTLEIDDQRLNYRIYKLEQPMLPGEKREMEFTVKYEPKGFEQSISQMEIMPNGSFFNNSLSPQLGYQPNYELTVRSDRRKRGLGEPHRMPALEAECSTHCSNTYLSNNSDWVDVETVISTSEDQIAIAPGSLIKEWQENGRRYFHYRLDKPSMNFYSFMSARYEVQREKFGDIDIEVYYHPEHHWNVPKMVSSIRKSLEYYTTNFGPYYHKQARIIEFPRYSDFAQAFPGTMPYSEGIGFIADLEDEDAIDMVYYIVAHEMAHQWWAHQVIGARMEGATLLSETLAQYSALMVMEKEYGRDMMRKFLQYEMDNYLRSRGSDALKEQPLTRVDAAQGYVHYRKGSVVLYYLKEMIGEDRINAALQELVQKFAYAEPPYPTSLELIAALRKQVPEEQQYLLVDLFERIVLFDNRVTGTTHKQQPDGSYEITIEFETKKLIADADGLETDVAMDDFVEVGAFARPQPGRRYGETLYRERLRLGAGKQTHTFTIKELPHEVGVDPFALLIDRVVADNLKRL